MEDPFPTAVEEFETNAGGEAFVPNEPIHWRRQTLRAVTRSTFLVSLPASIFSLILPLYGREQGADIVQIASFFSAFSLAMLLMRPLAGWGINRIGRRPLFLVGACGYTLSMAVFAFAAGVSGILLACVIQGLSCTLLGVSADAMVTDAGYHADLASRSVGLPQAKSMGAVLGLVVGFLVLVRPYRFDPRVVQLHVENHWRLLFLGAMVAGLVAVGFALRAVETPPSSRRPARWHGVPRSFSWILLLLLVTGATGAAWTMLSPMLIIFLQDRMKAGMPELPIIFLPAGLILALPRPFGWIIPGIARKLMIAALAVPMLRSLGVVTVLWTLQAAGYAVTASVLQTMALDWGENDQRSRACAAHAFAYDTGCAVGPIVAAWLYEFAGRAVPFMVNGVVLLVCALAMMAMRGGSRRNLAPANPPA